MNVWGAIGLQRRVIVVGAAVAVFVGVLMIGRMAATPGTALLYAGLDGPAAGEVIAALEQRSALYEVRGDAIYVDAAQRDSLRMTLAGEGLPASGPAGYEILDGLTGFGTTAQMFDAAYWRAREGELARTILANRGFRAARVLIAPVDGNGFRRDRRPSASVSVDSGGVALTAQQARGLRYLVASAVAGMTPADVAVIDGTGGLVAAGAEEGATGAPDDREAELRRNVERLMEARLGYGRAVVELSVDTSQEREQITERRFDPEGRVAISTETEENSTASSDAAQGAVTVASNLPDGAGGAGSGSSSDSSRSTERTNYEVSETQREVLRAPGAVKRITVAVMVDGQRSTDAAGAESWAPLPEEELAALRELVAAAVGFDEARGDRITIKSMPIAPPEPAGEPVAPGLLAGLGLPVMALVQLGVLAVVTLVIGLFVLRPILAGRALPAPVAPPGLPAPPRARLADDGEGAVPTTATGTAVAALPALAAAQVAGPGAGVSGAIGNGADPVARLRRLIEERQDETVEILRGWMEEREEPAR